MEYDDSMIADAGKCASMNSEYLHTPPDTVAGRLISEAEGEMERLREWDAKKYASWIDAYRHFVDSIGMLVGGEAISPMRSEMEMGVSATRTRRTRPFMPFFPIFRRK